MGAFGETTLFSAHWYCTGIVRFCYIQHAAQAEEGFAVRLGWTWPE